MCGPQVPASCLPGNEAKRPTKTPCERRRDVTQVSGARIEILLVEDNPGDVRLTQEAIRESKIRNRLNVVTDGEEAVAYVRRLGEFCRSAAARLDSAGPQPAQEGRTRSAAGSQVGS